MSVGAPYYPPDIQAACWSKLPSGSHDSDTVLQLRPGSQTQGAHDQVGSRLIWGGTTASQRTVPRTSLRRLDDWVTTEGMTTDLCALRCQQIVLAIDRQALLYQRRFTRHVRQQQMAATAPPTDDHHRQASAS